MTVGADPYHGWLTLAADPRLKQLESNGLYLISGQVDESQADAAGKPMYRMQSVTVWQPTPTF